MADNYFTMYASHYASEKMYVMIQWINEMIYVVVQ